MPRQKTLVEHLASPVPRWRQDLITEYLPLTTRRIGVLAHRFPGYDVAPGAYSALYLAALTWQPGGQSFERWLASKTHGKMSNTTQTARRRALKGIRERRLTDADVDARFWYLDREES